MKKICYKEIEIIFQNNDERNAIFMYQEKQMTIRISKSNGLMNERIVVADLYAYFVYIELCFGELETRLSAVSVEKVIGIVRLFYKEQPQFGKFIKVFGKNDCEKFIGAAKEMIAMNEEEFAKLLVSIEPEIEVAIDKY